MFFFPGTVYAELEVSQASQFTDALGKGNFHIILFKTQRFFMLDKCILQNRFVIYRQLFLTFIASKSLKHFYTLNYVLKSANDLKANSN